MNFKIGDKVRDLGLYPLDSDGVVVDISRDIWMLHRDGYFKGRSALPLVVKFQNKVRFYNVNGGPHANPGSTNDCILMKL